MQLLLILMLLLYGGKGENAGLFGQLKPLLESVGGEDVKGVLKGVLKDVEELEGVISAFGGLGTAAQQGKGGNGSADEKGERVAERQGEGDEYNAERPNTDIGREDEQKAAERSAGDFPLAPIAGIADREILYRLVQYFSSAGA